MTKYNPILSQNRINEMIESGLWSNLTILDYFKRAVSENPEKVAIISYMTETGETIKITYKELSESVTQIAKKLKKIGVKPRDVVSIQLPNWWHLTALHLACISIGAVTNALMPIFRYRELQFMLSLTESKILFVPAFFRDFNYELMAHELLDSIPTLEKIYVVGGKTQKSFEAHFKANQNERHNLKEIQDSFINSNEVIQLAFTSGTTGEPKAVMHTSNTLLGNINPFIKRSGLSASDLVLMASPLAHQTGFLYGLMMPIVLNTTAILQDVWNPEVAANLIEKERVTFTMASTPFLSDLTQIAELNKYDLSSLKMFVTAGAPIPRTLVRKAKTVIQADIISCWGMTENGGVTTTHRNDPEEKVFETDGTPINGMEVRIVDDDNKPISNGNEGRLQARGAASFVGYFRRPEAFDSDKNGWFETGDLAQMDNDGYIRISGRNKDVIIRGGENIPVVEVEGMIYKHPDVVDVAIVAMPDNRLGERCCAFIVLKPRKSLDLKKIVKFLVDQKISKNYLPERVEFLDAMPRTPSGKIQKFKLREKASKYLV
ncbi:MAG: Short-chain-fatty-acid--CoA ligase [Alphaproteobacteria bacterium MarineAlpha12_Bin1]|jgi:cyclohexanecarboxylate-CoA ligase|nr:MAG: Short-chain-fatty-acid--CoA ligase [Alphaproteobacteria bacterium MarineAlpha12_Bin1]|tara:strand:+ start:6460 stop:8100 length:1641 start_codon:yes stop_codon:yes gene_type:complete